MTGCVDWKSRVFFRSPTRSPSLSSAENWASEQACGSVSDITKTYKDRDRGFIFTQIQYNFRGRFEVFF